MDRSEKANELMARAERLGLHLEFDSGLITVSRTATVDPDRQQAAVEELGKFLPEVRNLLERRAAFARTTQLVGQALWSREFGEGKVESADNIGLIASFQREGARHPATLGLSADSVLIILDKEAGGALPLLEDQAKSDKPQKGFFGQLLRRVGEN